MSDRFEPDVLVVGSGAGGGSVAHGLTRAGLKVLILEAGPWFDPTKDYGLARDDWELHGFPYDDERQGKQAFAPMQRLSPDFDHLRSWNRLLGRFVDDPRRHPRPYEHVRGVGGTTLHFSGEAQRLHPRAMRMRSEHGVAADWPLRYDELQPWYQLAEQVLGVSGPARCDSRPRHAPPPLPAHPLSYASDRLRRGALKLGWGWEANPVSAPSRPYQGRPDCNYCGNCNRGCSRGDKGSVDVTFIRAALKTGQLVVLDRCEVQRVLRGHGDRVQGVIYRDAEGREQRATAPIVVLSAGAVETPRLLLNSEGIGNESGQVGRNLMELISFASTGLHPERLDAHRGFTSDSVCWDFNAPDAIPNVIGGCRLSPWIPESALNGPLSYARRIVGGWGRAHKQGMRERFGHALGVIALGESLPNERTFVDLDPSKVDRHGQPLARIHSHLDEMALVRLEFMARRCRELLRASGVTEIIEEVSAYDLFGSAHVFGTCRMGTDAANSVVNAQLRSHRWENLYVVDASVFPSSGGGEAPSLTIEALGLRAAAQIAGS